MSNTSFLEFISCQATDFWVHIIIFWVSDYNYREFQQSCTLKFSISFIIVINWAAPHCTQNYYIYFSLYLINGESRFQLSWNAAQQIKLLIHLSDLYKRISMTVMLILLSLKLLAIRSKFCSLQLKLRLVLSAICYYNSHKKLSEIVNS